MTGAKQTTDGGDAGGYTTGYTYKLDGSLDEETYPSGRVVKNILNNDGTLEMVESKKDANHGYFAYANSFTYNAAGAVTSMQLGNGKWESTVFNSRLQPTQIALGTTNTGALAYDQLKLNYDYGSTANNGNVQSQTITVPGMTYPLIQTYAYDSLNRLASATEASNSSQTWKQAFTYDRYGNRNFDEANTTTLVKNCGTSPNFTVCTADKKVADPAVNTANNRLSTGDNYAFDNAGNTTGDAQSRTFVYDAENKQISVSDSNGTIGQYFYDGDGKRVKKYVPSTGETTVFVYDAAGKEIAEYSTIVANSTDAKVNYLSNDSLGSPRINTDQNGNIIARHDYMPFGEEIDGTGGRITGLNYGNDNVRKQFTGKERDDESGLDYFDARYYSSKLGRFISPDEFTGGPDELFDFADDAAENPTFYAELEQPQSLNKYQYAYNSPYRYLDLDGHESLEPTFNCPPNCPAQITMPMPWWIDVSLPKIGPTTVDVLVLPNGSTIPRSETMIRDDGAIVDKDWNVLVPAPKSNSIPKVRPSEGEGRAQPQARPRPNRMARGSRNAQKANEDRVKAAKQKLEELKKQLQEQKSKQNKTPEDKENGDKIENQIKNQQERIKKSEEHARKGRGT